ncbi:hypothetical protein DV515_00019264 [Chloebia gouldiae]|uniref:Uncharacterized protein n=1 Tax=Chloebia gouldiae TaxID=44316 RepID=A0A3L8Q5J6_CHLGU|nr:hypothetical protein DV515_00019264 [Chloebia gouldiae]
MEMERLRRELVPGAPPKQRRGTGGTKRTFNPNSLEFLSKRCTEPTRVPPKKKGGAMGGEAEPCPGGASRS